MRLISSRALTVLLVVTFVYLRYYELYLTRNVLIAWGDAVETFDDAVKPSGLLFYYSLHLMMNASGRGIKSNSFSLGAKQY